MTTSVRPSSSPLPDWRPLIDEIRAALHGDVYWEGRLTGLAGSTAGLHLAVFVEPYLGYLLDGRKTVESRFAARRCPPYDRVRRGDILLLKRSGGPIVGLCEVTDVWFYQLDPDSWQSIRAEFAQALCAQDPAFWRARRAASFATLMRVAAVRALPAIPCSKRDRRGWVVLKPEAHTEGVGE